MAQFAKLQHSLVRLYSSSLKSQYDVIVIGGGAAGLMTAWLAGKRGKSVLVLERSKQLGRKILMSGGGRCNFTNLYVTAEDFLSENPHFVKSALSQYTQWDFIALVERHHIPYHERDHGQLFCDGKAKDIVDLLIEECQQSKVDILKKCDVESIHKNGLFKLQTNLGEYQSSALVIATGGLSIPHMDPTPYGYQVAEQFNMAVLPRRASLVPYTFSGDLKAMFARLSGVSLPVAINTNHQVFEEALLFTHRGLSGPAILQSSNYWHSSDAIFVNLLPTHNVVDLLLHAKQNQGKLLARTVLSTHLPKKLVAELETLWWKNYAEKVLADWPDEHIKTIFQNFNQWIIVPAGTEGYRTAEVTHGGVDTDYLSSKTLESTKQKGLFFVGEVVDVTGHLGGFNFQWAWSSAYACAQAL